MTDQPSVTLLIKDGDGSFNVHHRLITVQADDVVDIISQPRIGWGSQQPPRKIATISIESFNIPNPPRSNMDITVTLTDDEEKVLRRLQRQDGPVSVLQLGEDNATDGTTRAYALDRLERFGLIERAEGTTDYQLTAVGLDAIEEFDEAADADHAALVALADSVTEPHEG